MGCVHGKCCCGNSSSDDGSRNYREIGFRRKNVIAQRSLKHVAVPSHNFILEYTFLTQRGYYPDSPDKENQDSFCIRTQVQGNPNIHFFGVYDGHGQFGSQCSNFVKDRLVEKLSNDPALVEDPVQAYSSAFLTTNQELHISEIDDSMSGTTAITVLVIGDTLYVANVGDSRAVLAVKDGNRIIAEDLSSDQTPFRRDEYERVKLCGARVLSVDQVEGIKDPNIQHWGDEESRGGDPPRLWVPNGMYPGTAFTRSIGDSLAETIGVVAIPEVSTVKLTPNHLFFVVASDGVFEFLSSQTIVDMAAGYTDPGDACEAIAEESYKLWLELENRTDDITIIIVQIKGLTSLSMSGVESGEINVSTAMRSRAVTSETSTTTGSDVCRSVKSSFSDLQSCQHVATMRSPVTVKNRSNRANNVISVSSEFTHQSKMVSLVASGSSQMSPSVSVQEKGSRNKRKFRADPPLGELNKIIPAPQQESLSYEFSAEKFGITPGHGQAAACDLCSLNQDHPDGLKLDLGLYGPGSSSEVGLSQPKEELEADEFNDADWSDLTEAQLEELVLSNLDTIFKSAIKKIIACGYTEEVATKAILRSGICYGCKDTVSNIVDNTLAFLRNGQEIDPSREHYFEDLLQLEKYILAELVCVLREVRPFFSTGDAMWCLLICDMNVSHACAMDCDPLSTLANGGTADGCPSNQAESQSKTETKVPNLSLPSPSKSIPASSHNSQSKKPFVAGIHGANNLKNSQIIGGLSGNEGASCGPDCFDKTFSTAGTSQAPMVEEKCGSVRKVHSGSTKRDYFLRQKSFHVEKSYRTYGSKGSSRGGKLSGLSGLILDKKLKSVSESSTVSLKSASLQISKAMGIDVTQDNLNSNFSSNAGPSTPTAFSLDSADAISRSNNNSYAANTLPAFSSPASLSATDTDLSLSLSSKTKPSKEPVCCNSEAPNGSYMGIHYDKSLGQWIPQDGKDEMILKLVPKVRELKNQLQEWTEWANQKVMQAARRLSKDKAELQTLRQEKEEVERLKKEKQSLEENTMKKLSEMENALSNASGQVERANAAVRKLEVEKAALRREMEAAKLRATETAASCQEVSRREKKTQMKFQSWEKQKSLFQGELMIEKRKLAQLLQQLEQARMQQEQFEVSDQYFPCHSLSYHGKISQARWQQEAKAKEELLLQASSIRKEREQIEESGKSKEDMIKLKAERNLQRYRDDIHKLEKEIGQLRLKTDSSKIAALRMGIDGSYASRCVDMKNGTAPCQPRTSSLISELVMDYSVTGGVKRERECVMCLSEEMSVVFLPCAHQVVCTTCNELHEKQGMQDCPSCRSPIQQRIAVRFPRN
ncbi:Zinc finger, RING-type [Sesbania bispinosa]|nr:Zinc finger, RING-type [Sesbania bispinosa]